MSKTDRDYTTEHMTKLGRQGKGVEHKRIRCPRCGGWFGQLPAHLRACDGRDDAENP